MDNPVLVEVLRGAVVESRHRGAIAVVDADGASAFVCGDVDRPVFPRSSVKALQALRLIETGAADRYGLSDHELALACASISMLNFAIDEVTNPRLRTVRERGTRIVRRLRRRTEVTDAA